MKKYLDLDQTTIESYQAEGKKLGEAKVKECLLECIDFYQELIKNAERSDKDKEAAVKSEKALIMGYEYPELKDYTKRLEELWSTYRTTTRPTEI